MLMNWLRKAEDEDGTPPKRQSQTDQCSAKCRMSERHLHLYLPARDHAEHEGSGVAQGSQFFARSAKRQPTFAVGIVRETGPPTPPGPHDHDHMYSL